MEGTDLVQLAGSLGPSGVIIWILLQRHQQDRADRIAREALDRSDRKEESAAKNALASALTALALKIDELRR
ncbi:MAG TPA: hypothetical protein VGW34_14920 [Allosphingosinicella sp.]|nr:hypothetical protein [Allosphingosinicella sp.]